MTDSILIQLPAETHRDLWNHLLNDRPEQAAFVYAEWEPRSAGGGVFQYVEHALVPPDGFTAQSEYYMELTSETQAMAIKRAHDLQTSLVEIHSHRGPWPAEFSPSDLAGFAEFVPHVWWRLKKKPYLAIVVAAESLDGLAWIDGPNKARRLAGVITGEHVMPATGLSSLTSKYHGHQSF